MSEKILVPVLGESLNEATVSKWLKNKGDSVNADEAIVELETDKVNLEVPAAVSGVLSEINSNEGDTVQVGAVLGIISESEAKIQKIEKIKPKTNEVQEEEKIASVDNKDKNGGSDIQAEPSMLNDEDELLILKEEEEEPLILNEEVEADEKKIESTKKDINLSPAVRKIVTEKNIDVNKIEGSGRDGRILKGDLISLMGENPQPNQRKIQFGQEERIKMTRLRQTIAKRLKEAQENAAMLTTFNEVDMSGIISMRKENQEDFQNRYNIKLGFMSFFVKAVVKSLQEYPAVNAEIKDENIIYKNHFDIGIAVGTEKGLVVPILKDADQLSFGEIETKIIDLSTKAKDGTLTMDDLTGGTFTISNGGVYGSMLSTPIINRPQSGILGMHNIQKRAVVVNDEIVIRPMMYVALSYDHRIIDGKESVGFLVKVKELLEDPSELVLGI